MSCFFNFQTQSVGKEVKPTSSMPTRLGTSVVAIPSITSFFTLEINCKIIKQPTHRLWVDPAPFVWATGKLVLQARPAKSVCFLCFDPNHKKRGHLNVLLQFQYWLATKLDRCSVCRWVATRICTMFDNTLLSAHHFQLIGNCYSRAGFDRTFVLFVSFQKSSLTNYANPVCPFFTS